MRFLSFRVDDAVSVQVRGGANIKNSETWEKALLLSWPPHWN